MINVGEDMRSLQSIVFKWNILFLTALFSIFVLGSAAYFISLLLGSVSVSRIELLKQVSERSKIINKAAITMANTVYVNTSRDLLTMDSSENPELFDKINRIFFDSQSYFEGMDIELSLIALMKNGFTYSSVNELTSDLKDITGAYWYIDNFSNEKNEFWIVRFGDAVSKSNCMLSYGRVIRNPSGEYVGIVLVNSREKSVYQVYADILEQGGNIYILDENGYAISTSNKDLVGSQIYYMPAFIKMNGQNTFKPDYSRRIFLSNYYDPETKWTIVQESSFQNVFGEYYSLALIIAAGGLAFVALGFTLSLTIAKRISRPLKYLADKLRNFSSAGFEKLEEMNSYEEVATIGVVYNEMVDKIESLLDEVKKSEEIKRKQELEFLQLQINPHFLYNTLFSIKCLVELGKSEHAAEMLTSFMNILIQPIALGDKFVSLETEVNMLDKYAKLMSFRYESIKFCAYVEDSVKDCLIPRFLLQPIVENSVFHGFDSEKDEYLIELFAYPSDSYLIIKISMAILNQST